jgi:type I restriction enzyme M protein
MTNTEEQDFLNSLEKKLWIAADKLRSTLDASQYKHTVLGLVFLKYVSDAFDIRREELKAQLHNPEHDYYLAPEDFYGQCRDERQHEIAKELKVGDYLLESNTFRMAA